jgi:hypothetical protein
MHGTREWVGGDGPCLALPLIEVCSLRKMESITFQRLVKMRSAMFSLSGRKESATGMPIVKHSA